MKKILMMAAIASVALVSCVEKEESKFSGTEQQKITFTSPLITPTTRAAFTGVTYPENVDFKVYATHSSGTYASGWNNNFMDGVTVKMKTVESTKKYWAPDNDYYWPKSGVVSFAAYSPADLSNNGNPTVTYETDGLSVPAFELSSVLANQADLLYSERTYNKTAVDHPTSDAAGPTYYGVDIKFHHALSLLNFTVKKAAGLSSTITLTGLELNNIKNQGDFKENVNDKESYTSSPGWTAHTGGASITVLKGGSQVLTETAVGVPSNEAPALCLAIPCNLTASTESLTVKWSYTNGGGEVVTDAYTVNLESLAVKSWEIGTKYTYNITIDLDKIYFNPVVVDWSDGGKGTITVPQP